MVSSKDPQSAVQTLGVLCEITVAVLLRESDEKQLVNAAVSMKDCPLCIIELAQQLYPEQLLEIDDNGCTPLILATNNGLLNRGQYHPKILPRCSFPLHWSPWMRLAKKRIAFDHL